MVGLGVSLIAFGFFCGFVCFKSINERGVKSCFTDLPSDRRYFLMSSINTQPCFFLSFSVTTL